MIPPKILLLLVLISWNTFNLYSQRVIKGRIISEELHHLEGAVIYQDTLKLGEPDTAGYFEVEISEGVEELRFGYVGFEWTEISLSDTCEYLEVILEHSYTYHIRSSKKVDRFRKERFDKIPELHKQAVERGLFINDTICYTREFIPHKPSLDKITARIKQQEKEIAIAFEKFKEGDTIRIPFSRIYGKDRTGRTSLTKYAFFVGDYGFDCIIEGVILEKNKRRRGYDLVYKIVNLDTCEYDALMYLGREMKIGEVFPINMKYQKVLLIE